MKHYTPIVCLFVTIFIFANAQSKTEAQELEKFKNEQEQGAQKEEETFLQYKAEVTKQFDDYAAEQERLFKEYTGQIGKKWGTKNVLTSSKKEYVSYNSKYSSRSSVNFEAGTATVEVLMTEVEAKNSKLIAQKLKEQVAQLAVYKGGTDPLEIKNGVSPEERPILAEQLQTKDG